MRTLDPVQCFDGTAGAGRTEVASLGRYVSYVVADQVFRVDTETGAVHPVARFVGALQRIRIAPSGSHVSLCVTSQSGYTNCYLYRFEGGAFVQSQFSGFTTVTGDESRIVYGNSSAKFDGTDVVQLADVAPDAVETFPSQASEVIFLSDSTKTLRIVEP
jgi:tricorn protease-like protein